ncbi:hypothetical protein [Chromobacterium sp.]|uniref:hypothetical protein n=1 Tax=Chromobacterium sp. TaxID=306190 RepID=UPI0035AED7BD
MLTLAARKVDGYEDIDERHRQQRALLKRKTMESRTARRIEKKKNRNPACAGVVRDIQG